MLKYKYVLFDLDGTLTNSAIGITNSLMYALKKFDIEVSDKSELFKLIGPPLRETFEKYYGFSIEKSEKAVKFYREYYKDKGIYENRIYEGIEDLLKLLNESDKTLIVATSKSEVFAKQILKYFDIAKYFVFIAGGNLDGTRVKKDEVICYALDSCNISEKSKVIMIGDRGHDVEGAKKNSIHSMGVLFGYGDRKELENAGADYIVETVSDIRRILLAE